MIDCWICATPFKANLRCQIHLTGLASELMVSVCPDCHSEIRQRISERQAYFQRDGLINKISDLEGWHGLP